VTTQATFSQIIHNSRKKQQHKKILKITNEFAWSSPMIEHTRFFIDLPLTSRTHFLLHYLILTITILWIVIQNFPTAAKKAQGIDQRSVKRERSANTLAKWKNDASRLHEDFPRQGARSTVSCQSLRRLEVINYANERLMMPRRLSQPSGSLALGEKSSFKPQLARSDPLSRRLNFSDRSILRIRMEYSFDRA